MCPQDQQGTTLNQDALNRTTCAQDQWPELQGLPAEGTAYYKGKLFCLWLDSLFLPNIQLKKTLSSLPIWVVLLAIFNGLDYFRVITKFGSKLFHLTMSIYPGKTNAKIVSSLLSTLRTKHYVSNQNWK